MITEDQKLIRQSGLFASDIGRIMTGHAVEVALQKLGTIEPEDLDDVMEVAIGSKGERLILDAYEKRVGASIVRDLNTLMHPDIPWMGCHRDATRPGFNVEAKSVGSYNRSQWGDEGDEVPDYVLWQTQAQMACSGDKITDVPTCFVNATSLKYMFLDQAPPINIYQVKMDYELQQYMIDKCTMVWECIQAGKTPPPENLNDVKLIYQKGIEKKIEADDEITALWAEILDAKAAKKTAEKLVDDLQFKICAYMGDTTVLKRGKNVLATWRNDSDSDKFDLASFIKEQPELYKLYLKNKNGARKFLPKKLKGQ